MSARTRYGLHDRISDCYMNKMDDNSNKASEISQRGFALPCEIPLIKLLQSECEDLSVRFAKVLSKKDTNPEVIQIKKNIKKEFGIKNLYLDNNFAFAKKIQKSLKILKDNNIPLADEIIVNSILGMSMGISHPDKKIMLLNPKLDMDYQGSTESPLHIIIHEGIHIGQPDIPEINFQKMPDEYNDTVRELSLYASDNFILEIHAELKTKQLLNPKEFTQKEQKALDYIENLFEQAN